MNPIFSIPDDFLATIRIFTPDEGGRKSPVFNGIRWDFSYADPAGPDELYMIYPDFLTPTGQSITGGSPLPTSIELPARMIILVDEMREQVHRARIKPGVTFHCREGGTRVALGRVTHITGLFNKR